MKTKSKWTILLTFLVALLITVPCSADDDQVPVFEKGRITTYARTAALDAPVPAKSLSLPAITGITVDPRNGTVYLADSLRHMILRVPATGDVVEPFAGTQVAGYNGDGRPALETRFHMPEGMAVDPETGDLFVADTQNHRVRRIRHDGSTVETVAGIGLRGVPDSQLPTEVPNSQTPTRFGGDGGPANEAELFHPTSVTLGPGGLLYIGDSGNHRVRLVNLGEKKLTVAGVQVAPGTIRTIAGTGEIGFFGDGGDARNAAFTYPTSIQLDEDGNILVVDRFNQRIRRIHRASGLVDSLAVGDTKNLPFDAATALDNWFTSIESMAVSSGGSLIYADRNSHQVLSLDLQTGQPGVFAGTGNEGPFPEGVQATQANVSLPSAVAVGPRGEVYIVEQRANRICKVENGRITTFAGGAPANQSDPLAASSVAHFANVHAAPSGSLYVSDAFNHLIRRIPEGGEALEWIAGTGDSVPMTAYTEAVEDGSEGRETPMIFPANFLFIPNTTTDTSLEEETYCTDPALQRVWKITYNRETEKALVSVFAGNGEVGNSGDGGPAEEAALCVPSGIDRHPLTGDIYISNIIFPTIRKVDSRGIIQTVAGNKKQGFQDGPALESSFNMPSDIAFDPAGNLYISDCRNHRIRVLTPEGQVKTFAGTGAPSFSGDNGPASEADLNMPISIEVFEGYLYLTDSNNHRVRRISLEPPHVIETVAGTGERGLSGDGGKATDARLNLPRGLTVDRNGFLYVGDSFNNRIRRIFVGNREEPLTPKRLSSNSE